MAKSTNDAPDSNDLDNAPAPKPVRMSLAALGIGLTWGALHMPAFQGVTPSLIVWLIESLVAAVIAKAIFEVAGALLSWLARASRALVSRWGS